MQAEPDQTHLNHKGGVDGINFRPSSNFIHMKKYRKGNAASGSGESSSGARSEEEDRAGPSEGGGVQPPLPRDPPPPDSPPLTLKTEVEDDDYHGNSEPINSEMEEQAQPTEQVTEPEGGKKRIMCRQFARGNCTHGSACIFAHEIIISQLPGIYTFCKDYQNSICTFPHCKFVHATVFEKEHYYRTGYLPPHALTHIKKYTTTQPGSAPPTQGGQCEPPNVFPNNLSGPVLHPGSSGVTVTGGGVDSRPPPDALAVTAAIPPLKREWHDIDELGAASSRDVGAGPSRDVTGGRPDSIKKNKCSNCDITAYRLQCKKNQVEKLRLSNLEWDKKIAAIDKKLAEQRLMIELYCRMRMNKKPGAMNHFNPANARSEMEKAIIEKLNAVLLSVNNGSSSQSSTVDEVTKAIIEKLNAVLLSANAGSSSQSSTVDEAAKVIMENLNAVLLSANTGSSSHSSTIDEAAKSLQAILMRILRNANESGPPPTDGN